MSRARAAGVTGSVLVHVVVVLLLLQAPSQIRVPPKPRPVIVLGDAPARLRGEIVGTALACGGHHFDGLGLHLGWTTNEILDVGPDTPAARAGLRAGDIMLDPDQVEPDRFPAGHKLVLRILRGGVEIAVPVTIERVCHEP